MGLAIFVDFGFVVWGALGAGKSAGGNLGAARVNSRGVGLRGAFAFSVPGGARGGTGRVRTDVRQMAFRRYSPDQFRGCGGAAGPLSIDTEAVGRPPVGDAGAGFAAGFLRSFAFHVCGADAAGKCDDAERVATDRIVGDDPERNAPDSENILEIRGQGGEKGRQHT